MANEKSIYGGQAVIEGVMFGGKHVYVTAIRRKDNRIEYFEQPRIEKNWVKTLKKIPFVRGIVALIQSSANGSRHLSFAAERFDLDTEEEGAEREPAKKKEQNHSLALILGVAVIGVISLIVGKIIFTGVPALLAGLMDPILYSVPHGTPWERFISNLIEGGIKIFLLLLYLYAISGTPLIKRLFQYHGAEHKVINAYEAGLPLTVENVAKSSRLHYRCGSSFIIFTAIVGVLVYSLYNYFFPYNSIWERVFERILLIPVVIGVSYEVLFLTNKLRDIPVLKVLGYPGLWLQLLTTKEPTKEQIEVSIASFNRMRQLDEEPGLLIR